MTQAHPVPATPVVVDKTAPLPLCHLLSNNWRASFNSYVSGHRPEPDTIPFAKAGSKKKIIQ